ncbi:disease resistance protein RGA5-like [Triticum urartu]|uniref:disease resistance protein RGA5-like n=1 Tax=Triticum urartu TaxID=4572 RepID=UPI0020438BD7|nr:disease resistance protein RGA5-like [Triticum urartu]
MDPASGAIDSLLPKLEDLLLLCRGKLRKKARKELIFLKEKLTEIQLAFREVEDEPADQLKAQIKDWLRQARALSYCIEHVVDKFLARRLKAADPPAADLHELIGEVRFKWAIANASRQFAKEVETQRYRDRITELVNQHLDWSNTAGAAPSPRSGNASAMVANDHDGPVNELVDLDGRVEVLVSKILAVEEGEGQLKIASILGSAGVGKTTLVNRVYQQVNSQFECSAWVTVSQEPDIKHVLWTILCQISIQDYASFGSLSVEETVAEIRKALNNKRYFIVLEDLWDIKARETIKRALIDNSKGSAVLMTSHKVSVARYAGVKIY